MAKASDNEFPSVLFTDGTADPASPSASTVRLYFKDDAPYWINSGGTATQVATGAYATALSELDDVGTATPTNGQVLTYSTANALWEPAAAAGGGATALSELDDVGTATPTDGQVLTYSTANAQWEPAAASGGGGDPIWRIEPGLKPPDTAHGSDDEFEYANGTDLSTQGWTEANFNANHAATSEYGKAILTATAAASNNSFGIFKAAPAGDFTITAKVWVASEQNETGLLGGPTIVWGTALATPDSIWTCGPRHRENLRFHRQTGWGTSLTQYNISDRWGRYGSPAPYVKLDYDSTGNTITVWLSIDGITWEQFDQRSTAGETGAPDYIGIAAIYLDAVDDKVTADFFRVNWTPDYDPTT